MTDYTDLIARLRDTGHYVYEDCEEAADALEAQARRIAELEDKLKDEEYVSKDTNEMFHEVRDENIELRARIAKLEAALDEAAEICETIAEGWRNKPLSDNCGGYMAAWNCGFAIRNQARAARAALGEKE